MEKMEELNHVSSCHAHRELGPRLDGGAADEDPSSSSASLERLRPLRAIAPRFAADMLGRSGELCLVKPYQRARASPKRRAYLIWTTVRRCKYVQLQR